MAQQISVLLKSTGSVTITGGVVADVNGNLWDLPNPFTIPSVGQATVTATADAQNPNAPFPGSGQALTIEAGAIAGWNSAATAAQITYIELVTNFTEFSNTTNYPTATVNFWLETAYARLPACVWGTLLDLGVQLYAAHNLTLEFQNTKAAANGAAPGQQVGPVNSKSVSKVSLGYDTAAGSIEDGGNYNLTNYGTRFLELVDLVGVVGMAIIGVPETGLAGTVAFPLYGDAG